MTKYLFFVLFIAFVFTIVANGQSSKIDKTALRKVKRIYVEDDTSVLPLKERLAPNLKTEIEKRGFVVSDRRENADAILSSEISMRLTLDGDSSSPPDLAIYRCKLVSVSGEGYWNATFKFVFKSGWLENHRFGAQKIAEKLFRDWQKSVNKRANNK